MIILNCIRIRKLMEKHKLTIEDIKDEFVDKAHEVYPRLQNLHHCSFIRDAYPDSFVVTLARVLNCSVDYILNLDDNVGTFYDVTIDNPKDKEEELRRLVVKYSQRNEINMSNTNVLAYHTEVDRDIFEFLLKSDLKGDSWLLRSYYVLSNLSGTLGFEFDSTLEYIYEVDKHPENIDVVNAYIQRYITSYPE